MIRLIDNWKSAWRFASIQWSSLGVILMLLLEGLNQAWFSLPPHIQAQVPHATKIGLVLFACSLLGRLLKLKEKTGNDPA